MLRALYDTKKPSDGGLVLTSAVQGRGQVVYVVHQQADVGQGYCDGVQAPSCCPPERSSMELGELTPGGSRAPMRNGSLFVGKDK